MKFEYDTESVDHECVAFIDSEGDLCFRMPDGCGFYPFVEGAFGNDFQEFMIDNGAVKKFYPGDKITITF